MTASRTIASKSMVGFALAATLLCTAGPGLAANPDGKLDKLRAALETRLPNTEIASLRASPVPGLYEMVTGQNLFYVDPSGRYMVIGSLYDLAGHEDLTARRLAELGHAPESETAVEVPSQSIPWDGLPKDAAIVENAGAKYKLAVFTDVNCPYCRQLATILKALPEIEVHTYLIALWERSVAPTRAVLCAKDKAAALRRAYGNTMDLASAETCDTDDLERTSAFAARHGISGTPFLIRSDGATSAGLRGKDFLLGWLKETKQETER
ncbi:MAG: thioredoxin fold domain-containing protein [Alphaproteobacteria bacterium]|nr:thioredoxin fold domain-containing protein [Alphaproteobacteria bacterium]